MALDTSWQASFPDRSRPQLYTSREIGDDSYVPLADTSTFLLDDLSALTSAQLYSLAANNAEALQIAQQEWTNLERLALHIKNRDPFPFAHKDPQTLPDHDIFEERKEATLYSYKYEANRRMLPARFTISENVTDQEKFDCREPPEPFAQAGLIPNERQLKGLLAAANTEGREKNPDNQTPYSHNFADLPRPKGFWIVKQMSLEPPAPYKTRSRDAQLNGVAGGVSRQTRFNGERIPLTRDLSEIPSGATSPAKRGATPIDSPASKKRRIETVEVPLPKKKHPNQYTKRREAEEAARAAAAAGNPIPVQVGTTQPPRKKHPNQYTKRREREEAERLANLTASQGTIAALSKPLEDIPSTKTSSKTPDFLNMTTEQLRNHQFKGSELVALVKQHHTWLNDDPEKAESWKNQILNADYPVRTFAMYRKWAYWQTNGQDKRPRKKALDAGTDEVESMVEEEARQVKRSTRLRTRLETGYDSPSLNGSHVNGLEISASNAETKLDNLQAVGEMDTSTKIGEWQEKTDLATPGAVDTKSLSHGTEDEMYPSSVTEVENEETLPNTSKGEDRLQQNEAEAALWDERSTQEQELPASRAMREAVQRQNSDIALESVGMRRTRSSRSMQSNGTAMIAPLSPLTRQLRSSAIKRVRI